MTTVTTDKKIRGIALCAIGVEKIVSQELERLDLDPVERKPGQVFFDINEGNFARDIARANIGLRTAERVLLELGRFPAPDFDAFYEGVAALPWELCCFKDSALQIERVRSHGSNLNAQTTLQSMAQKAAYEHLMQYYRLATMPASGNEVSVRIYLEDNECLIGVDTSGVALHKRGYRPQGGIAPLKETIAASLLFFSGWNRKFALLDPFCGSGTIAIEAALYALDFAPGLNRRFAFEQMPAVQARPVQDVRDYFESRIRSDIDVDIRASDIDPAVLSVAGKCARAAGVEDWITFEQKKAEDVEPFREGKGILLTNPPYGKRLGTVEDAKVLYAGLKEMGDRFVAAGWGMGFITEMEEFGEYFGRTAEVRHHLINGAEDQWFHWYPAP
ncbi:MAG TPA: class I SAM-dependent RNA methyltransferase [Spirochaetales bacterium]|nr:class I SAM-dependent RNA methyltransferase [Spirochaetales bacterium]